MAAANDTSIFFSRLISPVRNCSLNCSTAAAVATPPLAPIKPMARAAAALANSAHSRVHPRLTPVEEG